MDYIWRMMTFGEKALSDYTDLIWNSKSGLISCFSKETSITRSIFGSQSGFLREKPLFCSASFSGFYSGFAEWLCDSDRKVWPVFRWESVTDNVMNSTTAANGKLPLTSQSQSVTLTPLNEPPVDRWEPLWMFYIRRCDTNKSLL